MKPTEEDWKDCELQQIKDAIHVKVYGSVFNGYDPDEVRIFKMIEDYAKRNSSAVLVRKDGTE